MGNQFLARCAPQPKWHVALWCDTKCCDGSGFADPVVGQCVTNLALQTGDIVERAVEVEAVLQCSALCPWLFCTPCCVLIPLTSAGWRKDWLILHVWFALDERWGVLLAEDDEGMHTKAVCDCFASSLSTSLLRFFGFLVLFQERGLRAISPFCVLHSMHALRHTTAWICTSGQVILCVLFC